MNFTPKLTAQLGDIIREGIKASGGVFLGGVIANTVGPIEQKEWDEMVAESKKPCGEIGCNCEKMRTKMFSALSLVRDDWRATIMKKN